ncbi:hypothetical protein CL632_03460 [bacterium]|nr:hypothetical protein [bacterium]MDP6571554.1 hypothetical protein [Patescibacteria group bacterium]
MAITIIAILVMGLIWLIADILACVPSPQEVCEEYGMNQKGGKIEHDSVSSTDSNTVLARVRSGEVQEAQRTL